MSKPQRQADLRQPTLSLIGHLPLITPRPLDQMHPATLARVEQVELMLNPAPGSKKKPDVAGACRLILAIEADLGITTDDRMAAVHASEPWETDLESALGLAAATANGQALAIAQPAAVAPSELPARERGRSPEDEERWDKARADLLNPNLALREGQKDARARTMAQVENAPAAEEERTWQEQSLAETIALAEGRGEEIATTKGGAKLIITHDGLWNLHERRKLTLERYEEGCAYRRDLERRSEDMGSQLGGSGGGSGHNNDRFVATRLERAKASAMVAIIDRAVALRCITYPNALQMLRWVAGQGHSIAVWGKGRSLDRNVAALCAALDVAATARKEEEERRRRGA
jgi:hypothetical protein